MLKIIPAPERNQYKCHFCGSKPVKYEIKCIDITISDNPIWVTCCNKCALKCTKDINRITPEQLKLFGKLTNLQHNVRLAYLDGMLDYLTIYHQDSDKKFIIALYNYLAENGQNNHIINEFYNKWKAGAINE